MLLYHIALRLIVLFTVLAVLAAAIGGWLPPAPELVYQQNDPVTYANEIYRLDIRSRLPFNLSRHPAGDVSPVWLPDASVISFGSNRGGDLDLYTVTPNGQALTLLDDTAQEGFGTVWSPDGTQFAYLGGVGTYIDVFVTDQRGNLTRQLTHAGIASGLAWSPDGTHLVFTNAHQNQPDLFMVHVEYGSPRRLTRNRRVSSPVWLNDGSQLAYTGVGEDGTRRLYAMDLDTDGKPIHEVPIIADVYEVAWSPDEQQIAYVAGELGARDLFVGQWRGDDVEDVRQITIGMQVQDIQWRDDGEWLVYAAEASPAAVDDLDLYALHVRSHKPRQLTANSADDLAPHWRPILR